MRPLLAVVTALSTQFCCVVHPRVPAPPVDPAPTLSDLVNALPTTLHRIGGCESSGSPTGPLIWTAHNPTSTAAGAWQILTGTWGGWEPRWGTEHFATAADADPAEQIRVVEGAYAADGTEPWDASSACWSEAA